MKDEKQLVLFFSKGTEVDGVNVAQKLSSKFSFLESPAVIPYNPRNPGQPLVVFNQGPINLNVGVEDVSIMYNKELHSKMYDDIMDIVECFEDMDFSFERMGYISTILHTKKDKEKFKENIFKDKDMINSEFQLSWYRKELIDSVSVNVWEKDLTDTMKGIELVSIFDINTPVDEAYNINSDFLRDFIKKCDKYIENRDNKYKK